MAANQASAYATNARFNADKIQEALAALTTAAVALSETISNIETTEKEPEFVMGNLKNVLGTVELVTRATREDAIEWNRYADARARR